MKCRLTLAALAFAFLIALAPAPVRAQTPEAAFEQVELTDATVENFIASYPPLQALSDKYSNKSPGERSGGPMESIGEMMQSQGAMAEMTGVLKEHGFNDILEWSRVAFSVMLAHKWNDKNKDPSARIDEAIAKVQADKDMPDQQKKMIIAQIESQRKTMEALRPLPENVETVARHKDALEEVVDNN